jgi:catalase
MQLPINRPFHAYMSTNRDGAPSIDGNYGALPNYFPAYNGPKIVPLDAQAQWRQQVAHEMWVGTVTEFQSEVVEADFVQPRETGGFFEAG